MTKYPQTNTDHPPQPNTDKHKSALFRVGLRRPGSVLVCVGLWLIVAAVAAAERPHFESQRRDGAISVDGGFDDWYGRLAPFGKDPVAVQFLNDGDFLYVRLTASDAATRMQIMRQGLTVWFDPAGGTKKRFGIMYPVVAGGPAADQRGGFGGRRGRRGEGASEDLPTPADSVNVIGPGKDDARSLTRDHLSGIEVAIRAEQGTVQYELKVPLAVSLDHPYAIGATPGKTIGFGLETPKMQQRSFGDGPGGGFGGGGGMGGGRGRGGGGMGRRGGGRGGDDRSFQPPKPLNGWATVTIAPVR